MAIGGRNPRIVAVSGLCGVGKSTAASHFAATIGGQLIYFGATVLRVVRERGLPETSESEQQVRVEIREKHGPACLAVMERAQILTALANGQFVFVDAVYCIEEYEYILDLNPSFVLVALTSSFETRLNRLSTRPIRPMSKQQLLERDALEIDRFKNVELLANAKIQILNDGLITELESAVARIAEKL